MDHRRKSLVITLITVALLAAVAAGVWFLWLKDYLDAAGANPVYVNPVSSIVGLDTGSNPRYTGVVEPQETFDIRKDESKNVKEIVVKEGDEIHVGDVLFRYDTDQLQQELSQAEIDMEGIAQQITSLKNQIADLEAEKKKANEDEKRGYTVEIQARELQVRQQENASNKKKVEVDRLRAALENTEVYSDVEGVVKEVNANGESDPYTGQSKPFITVLALGDYRVKGTVSELNVSSLYVGQAVSVFSRIDPEASWKGSVVSIDQETSQDQNNGYYFGYDSGEKSSKYHFYVTLQSPEGLILGQHVYIEPDFGGETRKEGIWLPAMYIDHGDDGSFVWAKNSKDRLEKRAVILGDYDNENDMYQIKQGLVRTDAIAYPSDTLKPGMPVTMDASLQDSYMNTGTGMTPQDPINTMPALPGGDYDIPEGIDESFGGFDGDDFTDDFADSDVYEEPVEEWTVEDDTESQEVDSQ